jgi:hypothetical protein
MVPRDSYQSVTSLLRRQVCVGITWNSDFELVKMTTTQPQTFQDEKITSRFDEKAGLDDVKYLATGHVDYTGSTAKTDPVEIRLVRKIDWRLMVSETQPVHEVKADIW